MPRAPEPPRSRPHHTGAQQPRIFRTDTFSDTRHINSHPLSRQTRTVHFDDEAVWWDSDESYHRLPRTPEDNDDRYFAQPFTHGSSTFHTYRDDFIARLKHERDGLEEQCSQEQERGDKYKAKYHAQADENAKLRREHQEQSKEITDLRQQLDLKITKMDQANQDNAVWRKRAQHFEELAKTLRERLGVERSFSVDSPMRSGDSPIGGDRSRRTNSRPDSYPRSGSRTRRTSDPIPSALLSRDGFIRVRTYRDPRPYHFGFGR